MLRTLSVAAVLVAACVVAAPASGQEWGTLKGQFVFDGTPPEKKAIQTPGVQTTEPVYDETLAVDPESKGIGNIVIYVRTKDVKVNPEYEKTADAAVPYDNKGFRFHPRVLTMRLSQTLEITNSDAVAHNSNFQPIGDEGINPLIPAGGKVPYKAMREQLIPQPVGCNIHPWMKGYILTRKNPYMAVTDKDGKFEIKDLPAGELEFQVWHELPGYLAAKKDWERGRFTMKIKPGENSLDVIKVSPDLLKSK